MGWKDIPDDARSEKIPDGSCDNLRVTRIITAKKDGTKFVSTKGDKQIMLIVSDDQDREAGVMITLSQAAAFKLKSFLLAIGADLDAMDADGVDWNNFADEMFATRQLCDRPFSGDVKWTTSPKDNKQYADVFPHRPRPASQPDEIPI